MTFGEYLITRNRFCCEVFSVKKFGTSFPFIMWIREVFEELKKIEY